MNNLQGDIRELREILMEIINKKNKRKSFSVDKE